MNFDIKKVIDKLKAKKKIFSCEAEFQLEMAIVIKETYGENVTVRLEYAIDSGIETSETNPGKHKKMYIDILVKIGNDWFPIELKYKTKGKNGSDYEVEYEDEEYNLKDQGARNLNCYAYWKDIERIEDLRGEKMPYFKEGYAIFLTNDEGYKELPKDENVDYADFSLKENKAIKRTMSWKKTSEDGIELKGDYSTKWDDFLTIINEKDKKEIKFYYLINKIEKN